MDTKDAIKETFLLEYAKKDYARINVKGLCAAVPVARTTFYSYYQNTDEVLEDIENDLMAGLNHVADVISEGNLPDMDFNLFLGETMRFVKGRWDGWFFTIRMKTLSRLLKSSTENFHILILTDFAFILDRSSGRKKSTSICR